MNNIWKLLKCPRSWTRRRSCRLGRPPQVATERDIPQPVLHRQLDTAVKSMWVWSEPMVIYLDIFPFFQFFPFFPFFPCSSTMAHMMSYLVYGGIFDRSDIGNDWRNQPHIGYCNIPYLQNGWFKTISLGKPWMGTLSASIYPAQDMTHSMTKYFSFQPGFRKVLWCAKCTTRSWPFFQACCRVQRKAQELLPQKWPFPKRGTPGFRQFLFFGDFICFHKDTDTDIIDYIHKYIHIYTLKIYMYCMYRNNLYI